MADSLWKRITTQYKAMQEHAPDGYEARVEVQLHGAPAPFVAASVKHGSEDGWLSFEVHGDEQEAAHPDDRVVYVHESMVAQVAIVFARKTGGGAVGFTVSRDKS